MKRNERQVGGRAGENLFIPVDTGKASSRPPTRLQPVLPPGLCARCFQERTKYAHTHPFRDKQKWSLCAQNSTNPCQLLSLTPTTSRCWWWVSRITIPLLRRLSDWLWACLYPHSQSCWECFIFYMVLWVSLHAWWFCTVRLKNKRPKRKSTHP